MAKHTEGPWEWGTDWAEYDREPWGNGEYDGPKYADIALHGSEREIIPLRIDHYSIEWDSANGLGDLIKSDRNLIAAAPDLLAACQAAVDIAELDGTGPALQPTKRDWQVLIRRMQAAIQKAKGEA